MTAPELDAAERAELAALVRELSVVFGRVTLSSGKEADYYVDLRRATLNHRSAPLIGRLVRQLTADWDYVCVGGLTLGADPVATAVMHAPGRPIDAFVVRKSAKAHGMQRLIEGAEVSGKRVLVVEDTSTTGGSALTAVCVGTGTGIRAFAAICAAGELDVLMAGWPSGPLDDDTAAFIAAMTDDLQDAQAQSGCEPIHATAAEFQRGRGERLDTFKGAELRSWASQCLASESGVLFTHVPDRLLRPMRTDGGELITAAPVPVDAPHVDDSGRFLAGLVLVDGRPAGALLDGPDGRITVGAELGLAFAVGRADGAQSAAGTRAAMVSRRGALFARLQTVVRGD